MYYLITTTTDTCKLFAKSEMHLIAELQALGLINSFYRRLQNE